LELTDNITSAKVSDSIKLESNIPDVACTPVKDAECPVDKSAAPGSTPNSINTHPINSKNIVANAVTGARGDANQNQITPITQPEHQNQEDIEPPVDEISNETPVALFEIANIPEPEPIPAAPANQCNVITPTNPSIGLDEA
jgi:hypothetical protein